jgi:hypothetical protein
MPLKILMIQALGNVGTSALTDSLLYPRLAEKVEVVSVDRAPEDDAGRYGIAVQRFLASEFYKISCSVSLARDGLIVDVSSPEFTSFVLELQAHPGILNSFDAVVIPVIPQDRAQREAINTVEILASLGLRLEKLRIIFNRVITMPGTTLEQCVRNLFVKFLFYADVRGINVELSAAVLDAGIHADLAADALSIAQVMADGTVYNALARIAIAELRPQEETHQLVRMATLKREARRTTAHLDAAFKALRIR